MDKMITANRSEITPGPQGSEKVDETGSMSKDATGGSNDNVEASKNLTSEDGDSNDCKDGESIYDNLSRSNNNVETYRYLARSLEKSLSTIDQLYQCDEWD